MRRWHIPANKLCAKHIHKTKLDKVFAIGLSIHSLFKFRVLDYVFLYLVTPSCTLSSQYLVCHTDNCELP